MKLAATAVVLVFVAVPALAQQYPPTGSSSPANPSATDQASPSAGASTSSSSDTRVASNRHHKKQRSSASTSSQMSGSQGMSNQESPGAGQSSPTPSQQQ